MANKIYITEQDYQPFLNGVKERISKTKFQGGGCTFTYTPPHDDRKAFLDFTPTAWLKMKTLVDGYTTEIEWHGLVERTASNAFLVEDILLFPHTVSATLVTSDQEEYEEWINSLDDETFSKLKFHGHSHVNMAVTPSGIDMDYRNNILKVLGRPDETTDLFYIFLIINKRGEMSFEIYDLQNNALYGTEDITLKVMVEDGLYTSDFLAQAKEVAKEAPRSHSPYEMPKHGEYYYGDDFDVDFYEGETSSSTKDFPEEYNVVLTPASTRHLKKKPKGKRSK